METNMYLLMGIIALLILLFLTIFAFVVYSGLFFEIAVKSCAPPFQNLQIAYKFARGPYKESCDLFTEVHSLAPDLNSIGVYYDDPRKMSADGLRYLVGVILNGGQNNADDETKERLTAEGYKLATFPTVDYVVMTTFPHKGTISVMIAIARVYPMMAEYIRDHKLCAHPFIEIYRDDQILFLAPLAKQDEFYVEETTMEAESGLESEMTTTHDERTSDEDIEDDMGLQIRPDLTTPPQEDHSQTIKPQIASGEPPAPLKSPPKPCSAAPVPDISKNGSQRDETLVSTPPLDSGLENKDAVVSDSESIEVLGVEHCSEGLQGSQGLQGLVQGLQGEQELKGGKDVDCMSKELLGNKMAAEKVDDVTKKGSNSSDKSSSSSFEELHLETS